MKKIFFALLTITSFAAFGQQPILVTMDSLNAKSNSRNSFMVDMPKATLKGVERGWLRYVGRRAKGKASVVSGEYIQEGAVNKNISPEPFTVYSNLIETPTGVRLIVRLGDSDIVTASGVANSTQDLAVQKFMRDFAVSAYRQAVQGDLKVEEKTLRTLEKEMSRSVKREERSKKKIKKSERSNDRDAAAIESKKRDIQGIIEDITGQNEMIKLTASDPNANKGAKKTLAQMESKKKRLERKIEKKNKDIADRNEEIRAEDRTMNTARLALEAKVAAIEAQREVVDSVKRKLGAIK